MAYESPIRLITELENKIIEDQREGIYKAVLSYRIDIGKDELFQLLYGDRKQYEKGFEDGWKERDKSQVRCKDCRYNYANMIPNGKGCQRNVYIEVDDNFFCADGERKDEADTETLEAWNLDGSPVRIIKGQKDEVEE